MSDYGFTHNGTVYTPNGTTGITPEDNHARNKAIERAELAHWRAQPDRMLAYYHLPLDGKHTYTPVQNATYYGQTDPTCVYCGKTNSEHADLEPDTDRRYRVDFYPRTRDAYVSTWLGTRIGAIVSAHVYAHNFGSRMISIQVRGTNGATYYGRASYDWGTCINLRKCKER